MILDLVIFEKNRQVAGNCTVGARGATLVILESLRGDYYDIPPKWSVVCGQNNCVLYVQSVDLI